MRQRGQRGHSLKIKWFIVFIVDGDMVGLFEEDGRDKVGVVLKDVDGCVVIDLNLLETD
jgi:hypothetical protein